MDYEIGMPVSERETAKLSTPVSEEWLIRLLRCGAFLCLAAWSWAHLYWEGPYGALFWNQVSFGIAERFGIDWDGYAGGGDGAGWIQKWGRVLGWLYVVAAVLALTLRARRWWSLGLLAMGSCLLTLMSFAKYLKSGNQLPMFVEHGGQMLAPTLLGVALIAGARHRVTVLIALIAFLATFLGHGSYALGLWPTPANYFGMTSKILQVDADVARVFLNVVGVLDFVICVGIFIPSIRRVSALYGAIWGLMTAFARPVAGMSADLNYWGADQYLHEAILRAPHFMIPLYLFCVWKKSGDASLEDSEPDASESAPDSAHIDDSASTRA